MDHILHVRPENLPGKEHQPHPGYHFTKHTIVPRRPGGQCVAALCRLAPGGAAYPYHYHTCNEELFYIISGSGTLRTPEGERTVQAGEVLFFPAGAGGAHKLINTSTDEELVYLDFDTANALDAAVYPDSGKIGVWGKGANLVFPLGAAVDYFDGE